MRPTVFAELRPVIGRKADALEQAWLVSPPNERAEIEIVAEVLRRQASTRSGVLLDAPDANNVATADGPVRLGRIVHGRREIGPLGLHLDEIGQHTAIVGRSGSGKSTLAFRMLLELKRLGIPWILIDFKRSARALRGLPEGRDIDVLSLGRGIGAAPVFNPLVPPPGVPEESHIRLLSEGLAREWYAGDGVISLAERALAEAYASTRPAYPTLAEVELIAAEMKLSGREKLWHQSLMRILGQMTRGPLGRLLCTRRDAKTLDALLTGHTIVELDGLAAHDANFIAELIVSHVSASLMQGTSREKLRCVIMIDECHRLLAKREGAGERPLELAMRESREIGLGTLLATQSASLLPTSVMANVFTFISMNCRHRSDINAASSSLLLREEQKELLSLLPTGEAVVRLSARWPHAVHLRVPRLDLPKGEITDADIGEAFLGGRFASLVLDGSGQSGDSGGIREREVEPDRIPARPFTAEEPRKTDSDEQPPHNEQRAVDRSPPPPVERQAVSRDHHNASIATDEPIDNDPDLQLWLKSIAAEPLLGVAARADWLGMSRRKANGCRQAIVEAGLAGAVELPIPTGKTVLLQLTERGRAWLRRRKVEITPVSGSLPHAWWQHRVAELLRKAGFAVDTEVDVDGHRVDVVGERDAKRVLVEIETGRSDWMASMALLA